MSGISIIRLVCSAVAGVLLVSTPSHAADYSGNGSWHLGAAYETATIDQNLLDTGAWSSTYPRLTVGGTGPMNARFEISWTRMRADREGANIVGLDGDVWLPYALDGAPASRLRPYLILGVGYHRYYGETSVLDEEGADNGARSLNGGLALVYNLTRRTELVATARYRYFSWDAPDDEEGQPGDGANATATSFSIGLQQLF